MVHCGELANSTLRICALLRRSLRVIGTILVLGTGPHLGPILQSGIVRYNVRHNLKDLLGVFPWIDLRGLDTSSSNFLMSFSIRLAMF